MLMSVLLPFKAILSSPLYTYQLEKVMLEERIVFAPSVLAVFRVSTVSFPAAWMDTSFECQCRPKARTYK